MPEETTVQSPVETQVIEENKRLSECLLWTLQENFYANAGLSAWNAIPYYPTSNAFICEIYADLIVNFLLDIVDQLDLAEPVYIIELAAGSGTFSFYVLKELQRKLGYFPALQSVRLTYVMTDFAQSMLDGWSRNSKLRPHIESGRLDFALLRPEEQDGLQLAYQDRRLAPGTVKNPVIAIANYFFDTIRQDLFRVSDHQLMEGRVTFTRPKEDGPVALHQLTKTEQFVPADLPYYNDERLNRILDFYRGHMQNASIIFPLGGFRCLNNLCTLSNNRLFLISCDKGFCSLDYMDGHKPQEYIQHHGAFSFMVNYDALGRYFRNEGGYSLHDAGNSSILSVMAAWLGINSPFSHLQYSFIEKVGRRDLLNGINVARRLIKPEGVEPIWMFRSALGMIMVSNYDPLVLYDCVDYLMNGITNTMLVTDYRNLVNALVNVRANMYQANPHINIYHSLEDLFARLNMPQGCIETAQESINWLGPSMHSLMTLARCYEAQRDWENARIYYKQAQEMDPSSPEIQEAIGRLQF